MTGRRRLIVRLLPVVAAIGATVPAAIAVSGTPASGERLLPDLVQETPTQLVVTKAGMHRRVSWRLGFRSAVSNVGSGPLIIEGARSSIGDSTMDAAQVIERTSGPKEVVDDAGSLRYVRSPDHQHWHLLGFDRYELRAVRSGRAVVRDRKTGFCLGDRYEVTTGDLPARAPQPVYTSRCGLERPALLGIREGISVGYGDDYNANLEGQYLPLDRLRPGRYVLVHRVNADRRLVEASYDNNASSVRLRLRWRRAMPQLTILAVCPTSARCAGAH